jgi:hypothetical protein
MAEWADDPPLPCEDHTLAEYSLRLRLQSRWSADEALFSAEVLQASLR